MPFRVRAKIWIANEEEKLIIGTGRVRILEAILECGSMNKAARKVRQPYRTVWAKIKATEERCGFRIVETSKSGSKLTKEGLELLKNYNMLRKLCQDFVNDQFDLLFGEEPDNSDSSGRSRF